MTLKTLRPRLGGVFYLRKGFMSHSSSRKKVLDSTLPFTSRASHARSCVNHVANRVGMTREALLNKIMSDTGVNLDCPLSEEELLKAYHYFESL